MALRRLCRACALARSAIAIQTSPMTSSSPPSKLLHSSPLPLSPNPGGLGLAPVRLCMRVGGFSSQAWVDVPTGRMVEVPLAQTGEGIAECELLKWFVQEGEEVEEFQRLCEVQSDKATIEITSRFKGKIIQIVFTPGDIVKVGETLLKILVEEDQASLASECLDGGTTLNSETSVPEEKGSLFHEASVDRVLSTPAVRNLAKQHGVDINVISGTGKDGRVLKEDVLKYATNQGIGITTLSHGNAEEEVLLTGHKLPVDALHIKDYEDKIMPLRGFNRAMVKSMTLAAKVPHFYYLEELNCDALVELKAAFQNDNSDPNVKHTFLPFLIKSLSMALSKYPILNSSFIEESNEVVLKGSHNIGVAMATDYGLVVPNIKRTQSLSVMEITKELSRLHQMASNNKLTSEDISDGTITLSNIGSIGGKFGSPLLNLPEVAIIAIGRIQKLPRFAVDETVYPASITNVTIGADHRIVDGATVAKFCNEWKRLVENPELLLLHLK
ncbi:lipoamide acyltransferase component of branched-chain alpha-keto acid dehydrogenase complex, mitochondrial [Dioscorea cayenensis subsp. rotundata]|uniref:Dihydrolipoamide acetyltransferase component of pyruvate dehydrogenase complex n=1 Tax=Dioscorea cayennensis subsp. rotundata TaxID=55577 RepID=A0AB40C9U8_DIOCR|nr:lipoamide acyltransferase component of branched-chain alpha-keto acid dehydrogenase complex, mitochondrial [Dioscorea cayenensis subsp. rotundata]